MLNVALLLLLAQSTPPILDREGTVVETERVERQFPAHRKVIVDNVWGSVTVTAGAPGSIRLIANKRLRARTAELAAEAKRDVKLDLTETGDTLRAYVDGPFRCQDGCVHNHGDRGYRVAYDFELQVPPQTDLTVKTVLDGDVRVKGVGGLLELSNVNGRVDAEEISGNGSLTTVNGGVRAVFRSLPSGAWKFKTINGGIDAVFPGNLSADLRVKTWHGEILTDFDVSGLPDEPPQAEVKDGRRVFRTSKFQGIRIARGGPELRFDTMNGTVKILKR